MGMSGIGLAAALALWAWWLPADEVVEVAGGKASAKAGLQSTGSPASLVRPTPSTPAMSLAVPPVSSSAVPVATTGSAFPITVAAPQKLEVGEMNELVVAMGANAGVNEVSFTMQVDADVLQVRAGTQGSWAEGAGLDARFAAEVSETGDRVQIRSAVPGPQIGVAGGSVAIVRFQAVGPGTTSSVITDVVVKDLAGRSIASAASASLQMTVDSAPPRQPEAWRQRRAAAVEPPAEKTEDGD
jgi:hypothetical protein